MKAKVHGVIGRGVKECYVNDDNILIFDMTDGKEIPIGFTGELKGIVPIELGGTNAKTSYEARNNLGITPTNIGAATSTELEIERNRIDNLASLKEGSTTGDAELTDIRVDYNGHTHSTAGNAVRSQASELKEDLKQITENTINLYNHRKATIGKTLSTSDGVTEMVDSRFAITEKIPVASGMTIRTIGIVNGVWSQIDVCRTYYLYNSDGSYNSYNDNMNSNYTYTNDTDDTMYIRFLMMYAHPNFVTSKQMIYYYDGTVKNESEYVDYGIYLDEHALPTIPDRIEALESKVPEIEGNIKGYIEEVVVPQYWNDEVENTINSVNAYIWTKDNMATNASVIAFVTDMHIEKAVGVHGKLITKLDDFLHFDSIVNGGDNYTSADTNILHETYMQKSIKMLNGVRDRLYNLMGNHDVTNVAVGYIYVSAQKNILITQAMKDNCHFEGSDLNNESRWLSYYRDDKFAGIRYIYLDNCYGYPDRFYQTDFDWINGVLKGTPSGYHVAVFIHNAGRFDDVQSTLGDNFRFNGQDLFYKMLSAFSNNTTLDYSDGNVSLTEDYSLVGKKVIGVFGGHTHADALFASEGINICTTRNAFASAGTEGTIDETAIDVIVINKEQKEVRLFRCGNGSDRSFTY